MVALDRSARREGHKAMESAISAAARVRRQLNAGRLRTSRSLRSHEALGRIVSAAERARSLMGEAGLNPDDLQLALILRTPTELLCKWMPAPGDAGPFFTTLADTAGAECLGILWKQTDRAVVTDGVPLTVIWVTPFVADREAQKQMVALSDFVIAGGIRMQAN